MKPEMILQADVLDILFEHRNKEYGAYILRRGYNNRLLKAMGSVPALVLLFFIMQFWINRSSPAWNKLVQPEVKDLELKQVEIEKPEIPKPPVEPPKQVATIKNVTLVIVPDHVKADPPPPIEVLLKETAAIGTETKGGEQPVSTSSPVVSEPAGTGENTAEVPEKETVLTVAEKMPEYPGGIAALRRFLSRHLRVPEEVMHPGQQVKVPIRFVVGKDGSVTSVDFLVPADEAFKKEILRVINKMPGWTPGSQSGRLVAVYYAIPIIFEIPE